MIEIDGSDGGGQLLRSALTASMLTGKPFEMTGIRGSRPEPGLRPQHLTAVQLCASICDATVSEVDVGSESLTFEPGTIRPGQYEIDIETAGSVGLLFDSVLPLATAIDEPLVITATGGTDVKWSPTMGYYRRVKLPLLRRFGLHAIVESDRPGFYPVGGGTATLRLAPSVCSPIELTDRGERLGARIDSLAATDLENASVAERQAAQARERLEALGFDAIEWTVRYADADSPGTALSIRIDYESSIAGFDSVGERGKPAESVADDAVDAAIAFEDGAAAVDRHTADQLMVFLAVATGEISIPERTDHVSTNRELLASFGFDLSIDGLTLRSTD